VPKFGVYHGDAGLLPHVVVGNDAGVGLERRVLRPERKNLDLAVGNERHPQVVGRHDLLHQFRMPPGKVHGDVAAIGMSHQGQVAVVRVRVQLLHSLDGEHDVEDAAIILRPAADIFFADLRHHRIVAVKIVLDADDKIATRGKRVGNESVFGMLDGVAMAKDHHRQFDHFSHRLHRAVAPNGDVDSDLAVAPQDVAECQRLVADQPLARGEIGDDRQRTD
jgi:hypothetical protein